MMDRTLDRIFTNLLDNDYEGWAPLLMPDGSAPQRRWLAEDGWIVIYTTGRVDRGRWAGRFVVMLYKPIGEGARSGQGKAGRWTRTYARAYASRQAAKARALVLYRKHSPRWDAKHPVR